MRAPALLAAALASLLRLSAPQCAEAQSPADSLLARFGDPQRKEELHSWLEHATIDELCGQLGESFRALAPNPASSPDQEFARLELQLMEKKLVPLPTLVGEVQVLFVMELKEPG